MKRIDCYYGIKTNDLLNRILDTKIVGLREKMFAASFYETDKRENSSSITALYIVRNYVY